MLVKQKKATNDQTQLDKFAILDAHFFKKKGEFTQDPLDFWGRVFNSPIYGQQLINELPLLSDLRRIRLNRAINCCRARLNLSYFN